LLELHALQHGFTSSAWASFDQWKKLGCVVRPRPVHVKPGAWGTKIVFYRTVRKTIRDQATGEEQREEFPVMRLWTVFNADQVDGEAAEKFRVRSDEQHAAPNFEPAEELIAATGAIIQHGGNEAFYRRPAPEGSWPNHSSGDFIVLPDRSQFETLGRYYETALHELAHWSEVRLDWNHKDRGYALGELVAEIASCFISQELGVPQGEPLENHAAYLKAWIKEMKSDPKFIFQASSQASKVADFLMSFVRPREVEEVVEEEAVSN
jgi:antirestriction protein ArdC